MPRIAVDDGAITEGRGTERGGTEGAITEAGPHPAGGSTGEVASIAAQRVRTFRLDVVTGLFDPDSTVLLDHLAGARRLLAVVAEPAPATDRLRRYLRACRERGALEHYRVISAAEVAGLDALAAIRYLASCAVAERIGRRDAFLSVGSHPGTDIATATAELFHRYCRAVRVVSDPVSARALLRCGDRTEVAAPPIAVGHRHVTVLVDADRLGAATAAPRPVDRRVDTPLAYTVEAVRGVLDVANPALSSRLPAGAGVLAFVDGYRPGAVPGVRRYLLAARRDRALAGVRVVPVRSTPSLKESDRLPRILDAMARMRLTSHDRVLVVGGGTLMDLVGTAVLLYPGSTPYLRIPTTLVGLIDAGIGLKVGVDVDRRKNLLGGYHPPLACLCDRGFLRTLPAREIRCGLAEAIKIAMVADRRLFELIERHHTDLLAHRDSPAAEEIVHRSITAMIGQLQANPLEENLRRLPDFGHEFGHSLEAASDYRLRHGEAVSIGMALAGGLATRIGRMPAVDYERMLALLTRAGLPVYDPLCEPERLWRWLRGEVSAHKGGAPHLVIPTGIGSGDFIDSIADMDVDLLRRVCANLARRQR